ncbi:MAG TPA: D-alanyl-D-alanine carboxypeptidase family protein [Mycobacterium sp.]|nr:D-alanyl-D-alanine carboxypeptidase family protein [Mycobacterium sp.]
MRKFIALVGVMTVGILGLPSPAVADISQPPGSLPIPEGPAPAWIVADLDSGQILAEQDGYAAHPPASTIKVLLALTALDEVNLDSSVIATPADTEVECSCVGIKPGQSYTARQLLDAVLLVSGNDAAMTLSEMLGGPDTAVAKMNAKAQEIGATTTHAATPSGLDGPDDTGWTTPRDLAVIMRAALANPVFAQITAEPGAMFPNGPGGEERPIGNQNELLFRYPGAIGGKTGFTNAARKTYVGAADRDGRRLVVAMMYGLIHAGGPNYWDQATSLLDWGFGQNPMFGGGVGTL